jgi:alpha-N-acetylglucosaminidase
MRRRTDTSVPAEPGPDAVPWAPVVTGLWTRVTGRDLPLRVASWSAGGNRRGLDGAEPAERAYEVHAAGGTLHVAATDAISASVGIHRYLTAVCGIRVTWDADLPLLLGALPDAPPLRGEARVAEFSYLNFCTFGYSTAYWGWAEWEREIDWMALHGVTMPLALVGHEAVLSRVYTDRGLTEAEIRDFLGGPGYLPWQYLGCLDGFAGPLPAGWTERHLDLGRRILERERAFGMTPVLPAFTGHLPRQLAPAGSATRRWQGLETTVVAPEDPLFRQLTTEIATAQRELLGTDHRYASDPFIETLPTESARHSDEAADHPAEVAAALVEGLRAADPDAVWVLQSWPFSYLREYWTAERVARFLDGVPRAGVVVLDLWAEAEPQWARLGGYAGRPWLWNALLNFGGRSEPVADLESASRNLEAALGSDRPPVGLGLAMEAIHVTPAFYELVADRAWRADPARVADWVREFGRQRYRSHDGTDVAVDRVWDAVRRSVLDADSRRIFPELFVSVAVSRPDYLRTLDPGTTLHDDVREALCYRPADLLEAVETLLEAVVPAHGGSRPVADDLALLCAALLVRVVDHRFGALVREAVRDGAVEPAAAARFLETFDDLDDVVGTRPALRLDTWVAGAVRWAADEEGRRVLADNARRVVTVWNTPDNPRLDDYSARLWSGLVRGWYKRRYELWLRFLPEALDPAGRAGAQAALDAELGRLSEAFLAEGPGGGTSRPSGRGTGGPSAADPPGDVCAAARRVLERYGDEFRALGDPADDREGQVS